MHQVSQLASRQKQPTEMPGAMGSDTFTEAQCRRLLNEQQISMGEKMDAVAARNQELEAEIQSMKLSNGTIATANSSHTSFHRQEQNQDQRKSVKDATGKKWFQVKFHCSKHRCNASHSDENCNNKMSPKGHPWIAGAALTNTKGGNNALADKFNHLFERST